MPSLNLDIDYFDHPKTTRLIRLLGRGSEVVPLRLWAYTARYFPADGRLTGISTQEIEEACRWWGKSGDAVSAMLDCVFLERDGETFIVHDWEEHEGHIEAFRKRAQVAANARWDKIRTYDDDASSNASSNALTCNNQPTNVQDNPTLRKRRVRGGGPDEPAANGLSLQARVMKEVWQPKWAEAHHGEDYSPSRVDFVKLAEVLKQLGSTRDEAHAIERFSKIADTALSQPEEFGWQGHKLTVVQKNLQWLISETAARHNGTTPTSKRLSKHEQNIAEIEKHLETL